MLGSPRHRAVAPQSARHQGRAKNCPSELPQQPESPLEELLPAPGRAIQGTTSMKCALSQGPCWLCPQELRSITRLGKLSFTNTQSPPSLVHLAPAHTQSPQLFPPIHRMSLTPPHRSPTSATASSAGTAGAVSVASSIAGGGGLGWQSAVNAPVGETETTANSSSRASEGEGVVNRGGEGEGEGAGEGEGEEGAPELPTLTGEGDVESSSRMRQAGKDLA